jgi:hypothetical protein
LIVDNSFFLVFPRKLPNPGIVSSLFALLKADVWRCM